MPSCHQNPPHINQDQAGPNKISFAAISTIIPALLFTTPALAQDRNLFNLVPLDASELTDAQQEILTNIQQESTTADVTIARVRPDILDQDRVTLNVSAAERYDAEKTSAAPATGDEFTWLGDLTNAPGSASLVVQDNNIHGTIRAGTEVYSVRSLGSGLHAIVKIDTNQFPQEHPPSFDEIEERSGDVQERLEAFSGLARAEENPVIDVLVAYTPAAANGAAATGRTIDGLIEASIAETNNAYQNSGIRPRLRLVHSYQVNYTETSPSSPDAHDRELRHFRENGDGQMDEVHALRDEHGADVAVLLIDNQAWCGLASRILAQPETAFAVVHYPCSADNLTLAHEVGHLQGARHNPEVDPTTTPYAYGHGFLNVPQWRTVMAYRCPPPAHAGPPNCPKIPHFSNPDVSFSGIATGTAGTHNNARVINETGVILAAFRTPLGPRLFSVSSFSPWSGYAIPNGWWAAGDISGDGKSDLVHLVAGTDYAHTWTSNGDGTFGVGTFRPWAGYAIPNGVWAAGDLDGDSRADLVHLVDGTDYAHVWTSNGDGTFGVGTFRPWQGYAMPNGLWIPGDISGDRKIDLVHLVQGTDYAHPWISNMPVPAEPAVASLGATPLAAVMTLPDEATAEGPPVSAAEAAAGADRATSAEAAMAGVAPAMAAPIATPEPAGENPGAPEPDLSAPPPIRTGAEEAGPDQVIAASGVASAVTAGGALTAGPSR